MKYLAAIALIGLVGCVPRAIVVSPIAPKAVRVTETAKATAKSADKVSVSIQRIKVQSDRLSEEIIKGMLAADALRKAGLATQAQLDSNSEQWQQVHARNLFLEAASQSATIDAKELQQAAERGKAEAEELEEEAVKTDKATEELKSHIIKQEADASRGRAVKHAYWLIIGCGLLYLIIRFVLPLVASIAKPL